MLYKVVLCFFTTQFSLHAIVRPSGSEIQTDDTMLRLDIFDAWTHHFAQVPHEKKMIFAGIGKPTYVLNKDIADAATNYWQQYVSIIAQLEQTIHDKKLSAQERCDIIAQASGAIDYGSTEGEYQARDRMAQALSKWYGITIEPDALMFTVGGIGALNIIFQKFDTEFQKGSIVTPLPHYPYYYRPHLKAHLHFIDCMQEPGYRLTADALKKTIACADGKRISAFLFCDPNNPLGTVVGKDEWEKVAAVLKTTAHDIPIILDEAYAEMVFGSERHESLLSVAPELKDRIILLRSATKGFSASGERMAIIVCHNVAWREQIIDKLVLSCLHAPKSLQYAYAQAMLHCTPQDEAALAAHYAVQSEYVQKRVQQMGAQLPDHSYKPAGTFYVLADLSALFGTNLCEKARTILGKQEPIIETDEEICYSLLCEDRLMITPLSYFGVDPQKGYVRITCSRGMTELKELMDRIERRLSTSITPKR